MIVFLAIFVSAWAADPHQGHPKPEEPRVSVEIPITQQEKMGLKVAKAEKKAVSHTIRTVGTVTADQRREAHVHSKINGWIENIHADYIGKPVKKGQTLFEFYSPELVSTQEEYLSARRAGSAEVANAAIERLKLWGVPDSELARLRSTKKAKRTIGFDSPVNGIVVNKTAIQGMYITPEMELYHIADLSQIWVLVTLYEYDLATVTKGDAVVIEIPYDPGKTYRGKIDYVYPEIETETRTAKARVVLDNPKLLFKPGMFTNVELQKNLGESIVIPDDSVIDTGTRKIVFVKSAAAKFEPREIAAGPRVSNRFVVLKGLKAGEEVVTAANFLVDAESKLQAALQRGEQGGGAHVGHGQ